MSKKLYKTSDLPEIKAGMIVELDDKRRYLVITDYTGNLVGMGLNCNYWVLDFSDPCVQDGITRISWPNLYGTIDVWVKKQITKEQIANAFSLETNEFIIEGMDTITYPKLKSGMMFEYRNGEKRLIINTPNGSLVGIAIGEGFGVAYSESFPKMFEDSSNSSPLTIVKVGWPKFSSGKLYKDPKWDIVCWNRPRTISIKEIVAKFSEPGIGLEIQ